MRRTMRPSSLVLLASLALLPAVAAAQPSLPITGNVTIASDYRFRGISQTYLGPAVQGGIDYAHPNGVYLGNWNSSVSSEVYTGGSGIEMDFYAGYKRVFGDLGIDVGTVYYHFPKAKTAGDDFHNWEVYAGASLKWFTLKVFYALSDYFGLNSNQAANYWISRTSGTPLDANGRGGTKGTYYAELNATIPLGGQLSLAGHYGRLDIKKYNELDYEDWKIGVNYDLAGWLLGAFYVDSLANNDWWYTTGSAGPKDTGRGGFVFSVSRTF